MLLIQYHLPRRTAVVCDVGVGVGVSDVVVLSFFLAPVQEIIAPAVRTQFRKIADFFFDRGYISVVRLFSRLPLLLGLFPCLGANGIKPFEKAFVMIDVRTDRIGRPDRSLAYLEGV